MPRGPRTPPAAEPTRSAPGRSLLASQVVRHLYIHVPFCVRRCSYCDFSIAVRKRVPAADYLDAIRRELQTVSGWVDPGAAPRGPRTLLAAGAAPRGPRTLLAAGAAPRGPRTLPAAGAAPRGPRIAPEQGSGATPRGLETLYLGGGTPSLLPPEAIATLVRDAFRLTSSHDVDDPSGDLSRSSADVEITIEANPEDVTAESTRAWRGAGVNRVSLGAQSFDDRVLRWMHRSHDAVRVGAAVATLRDAGIDDISLDLIFGLPAELGRDWRRDLDRACGLRPAHLSLYGLTVEDRTPLARWISRGATRPPADDRYAAEYLEAHERLASAGYCFYEVSNAAREGRRSRHNAAYWSGRPYLGLGPAAHSFDGHSRRWNLSAWESYRRAVATGRSPVESEEKLTPAQLELERVYLALRTEAGLPLSSASDRHRPPLPAWVRQGWVEVTADRVRCTPEGWLRLDALVAALTGDCQTV